MLFILCSMITYYDTALFESLPFYSVKAIELKVSINRSEDRSLVWNIVEKGFYDYLDGIALDETLVDPEVGSNAYSMLQLDTYMSYSAKKYVEDHGYTLCDGRFVADNEE